MTPDPELHPCPSCRRLRFADASSQLVVRAFTDAHERLLLWFPNLSWPTWSDALRELRPDLLVHGKEVTFDWQALTMLAQQLAASPQRLPQLPGLPEQYQVTARPTGENALPPSLSVPAVGDSSAAAKPDIADLSPTHGLPQPLLQPIKRQSSRKRTFRNIIEHHPRGNGKFGFTVRELCTTMHIAAETLTKARKDPGRLSLNSLMALADAMGEPHLDVMMDVLVQTMTKKARANAQKQRNTGK